jgi:[citrate (pro-3S)-lyase] ligase
VTAQYNAALARLLPEHGIALDQIPRLESDSTAISASAVRELLASGNREAIASLVPQSTYDYLLEHNLF